jgi:hypothetical protein
MFQKILWKNNLRVGKEMKTRTILGIGDTWV